jgi:hypothetical protein
MSEQTADLIAFLRARLDEDEQVAREASRRMRDGWTPTGEHWQWVEPDRDQVLTLDPVAEECLNDYGRADLRSVEEYPVGSDLGDLPHFVVRSEEVRTLDAMHIARWDPARVLAEVEAKRRVIKLYENALAAQRRGSISLRNRTQDEAAVDVLGEAVKALALPYADHADYRDEWRPEGS